MKAMHGAALASLVAIGIAAQAQTQAPPRDQPRFAATGTATISGVVIADDEARAPLRGARVSLERSGLEDVRSTTTDDQGRYGFSELPAGTYFLNMGKAPFVRMEYGAPKPGMPGRPVVLADGEQFGAAPVALLRGAVIAGRLRDRNGRPVPGTEVTATQVVLRAGQREGRITTGASGSATTSAHGEYRIYGLLPGEYLVFATASAASVRRETTAAEINWTRQASGPPPPGGRPFVYSPTWYPGTVDPQTAPLIRLTKGEERPGVDFALTTSPVSNVSGVVTDPGGGPASSVSVRVAPSSQIAFGGSGAIFGTQTTAEGKFAFGSLPAGEYTVAASGGLLLVPFSADAKRITSTLWGLTTVNVSGQDVGGLAIRLQTSLSVTGQVVMKSAAAPAWDLNTARVTLVSSGGLLAGLIPNQSNLSLVSADGTFKIDGVLPGSYRVQMSFPPAAGPGWSARSAMAGTVDAMDVPIEIGPGVNTSGMVVTITDSPTELSGTIADTAGKPAELYVFAFSTDRAHWRFGSRRIAFVRSTEKGSYSVKTLPPGEYYLLALTELDLQMRYEVEYLETLVAAGPPKITLSEGEKKQQNLQIGSR